MTAKTIVQYLAGVAGLLLFCTCGSDKKGDAIGTIKTTEFPETYEVRKSEIFEAPRVTGPDSKSVFPEHEPTSFQEYSTGYASRMAIYVTDSASSWLGIAHGLKAIGVPFIVTGNI